MNTPTQIVQMTKADVEMRLAMAKEIEDKTDIKLCEDWIFFHNKLISINTSVDLISTKLDTLLTTTNALATENIRLKTMVFESQQERTKLLQTADYAVACLKAEVRHEPWPKKLE